MSEPHAFKFRMGELLVVAERYDDDEIVVGTVVRRWLDDEGERYTLDLRVRPEHFVRYVHYDVSRLARAPSAAVAERRRIPDDGEAYPPEEGFGSWHETMSDNTFEAYLRDKMREPGFLRKMLPPLEGGISDFM